METKTEIRAERWLLKCRRCKHIITREVQVEVRTTSGYYLGGYCWDVKRNI